MRQADSGLQPCARYSTSWALPVIGAPREFGGADMTVEPASGLWGRAAGPIADQRLDHGESRKCRRIGPQDPGTQADSGNKREFPQTVKLIGREAALRPDQDAERRRALTQDLGDRRRRPGLITKDEATILREARYRLVEALRLDHFRHAEALGLLG